MKSVLEICDGDSYQLLYVPDTPYVIETLIADGSGYTLKIRVGGIVDHSMAVRAMAIFRWQPIDAYTMRRIGCWLREGAPESFVP